MRAVVCEALGPPDWLIVAEHPEPELGPGEVLIDVVAASINFPDLLIVQGLYQFSATPPFVPGAEGAGVVAALGDGVSGLVVGDEVIFAGTIGAFAERTAVPADSVVLKPEEMSWAEAASFGFAFGTSYHALKQRAALMSEETVLVLGAAGGVGSAAVQLGAAMGATVIAAASTEEKLDRAKSWGASHAINYTDRRFREALKEITDGRGVDVVVDPVGGSFTEPAIRSLAWGGRYLVIGFAAGEIPQIALNLPLLKGASIVGVFWGSWLRQQPHEARENWNELVEMYRRGVIAPPIMETFDLDRQREAFQAVTNRRVLGKVVLQIRRD